MYPISSLFKSDIESKALRIGIIAQSTYFWPLLAFFVRTKLYYEVFRGPPKKNFVQFLSVHFMKLFNFLAKRPSIR